MQNNRVPTLDGLRVVAIVIVMLYHYYSYFDKLYTYNFNGKEIFQFGHLGVQLFFIISGFVIMLTLENSSSFLEFIKKRFIRLIPGMLICSSITFLIFKIVDPDIFPVSQMFKNLLVSNTLISPRLINYIFGTRLYYIDGAYWTLWVEISFYVVISIIYFTCRKNLYTIFTFLSLLGSLIWVLFAYEHTEAYVKPHINEELYFSIRKFVELFPFLGLSLWFLVGIFLLELYRDKSNKKYLLCMTCTLILLGVFSFSLTTTIFIIITYIFLLLFIYKPGCLSFLNGKLITKIGVASYSIYLIHNSIGVLFIYKLSPYLGSFNWILGIIMIILVCLFGLFSYKYLEKPLSNKLRKSLIK